MPRILLVIFTACVITLSPAAGATLLVDATGPDFPQPCIICGDVSGRTGGWDFVLSDTITIDGLGFLDVGSPGLGTDVEVGLWNGSGTLLASAVITDASTAVPSLAGIPWLIEDISPLDLAPGTYVLGALFFSDLPLSDPLMGAPTIPEVTRGGGRIGPGPDSGFQYPADDFIFSSTGITARLVSVPEPGTFALLSLGALALGFRHRQDRA